MIIEIFISILLKIIIIFLFIKNQSKNFSFNPPSTNISIYFKKISYLLSDFHSPIFNIQSKIPGKTISLIFLLFFFNIPSTIYKIPISKISSSINIAHLSIPPLTTNVYSKQKRKKRTRKISKYPLLLIHLEEKRRNSANVIKQSPEFRYSIHVSLQQVFPLISKNPRQTGHPAGA